MRVGALIKSYHSTQFLPLVLKQYEWVDKIVVMNYRFKTVEPTTDDTIEICKKFGHPNLSVYSGDDLEQHDILNVGLDLLKGCDLVWIGDADEIILPEDQNIIMNRMADRRPLHGLAQYATCKMVDYNGDLYHASPQRPYDVMVMAVPSAVRFSKIRMIEKNIHEAKMSYATVHHLGLCLDPNVIDWKAGWEYKEEGHSKEKLLSDWAVRREVVPPVGLVEYINSCNLIKKSTWGYRIEKVPYKENV